MLGGKVIACLNLSNGEGHYSFEVRREMELSNLLLRDEELVLPEIVAKRNLVAERHGLANQASAFVAGSILIDRHVRSP